MAALHETSEQIEAARENLPSHSTRKGEMVRSLAKLGEDAEWWADQMALISEGKTLEELAVELKVNYGVYRHWIMGNVEREKQYEDAIKKRKATLLKRVEDRLFTTALNPTGHATYSDANRAAEILLTRGTAALPGAGVGQINLNVMFVEAKDGQIAAPIIDGSTGNVIDQVP